METLQTTWFILFFVLFTGYAVLDGFDLGMGLILMVTRKSEDRDILARTLPPFWDGNELWLVTAGSALFATFHLVYSTLIGTFGVLLGLVLLGLIVRTVAFGLRQMIHGPWQRVCDIAFGLGSLFPAVLLGLILANILRGLPLNKVGAYQGAFLTLMNPYGLLGGSFGLVTFALYGAAFGATRTRGDLQNALRKVVFRLWPVMIVLWICMTVYSPFATRHLLHGILRNALFDGLLLLFVVSLLIITISSNAQKDRHVFLACSVALICMLGMAGVCLYPNMIPASPDLANSLTLETPGAPPTILKGLLVVALAVIGGILIYRAAVYRPIKNKLQS